jgi:hypothetical protein
MDNFGILMVVIACVSVGVAMHSRSKTRWLKRAEFIRFYQWQTGLLEQLGAKHPALTREDMAAVS